jgi:hypothetical protein
LDLRWRKWLEAGEDCIVRSFITFTLHQCYYGDKVKEDEIGGACGTGGKYEKCTQYFGWKV